VLDAVRDLSGQTPTLIALRFSCKLDNDLLALSGLKACSGLKAPEDLEGWEMQYIQTRYRKGPLKVI